MTSEEIGLVQTSFKAVVPIADTAADLFYGRLFEIAPQVRLMFPADMAEQKKKLMQMLGVAVANLHQMPTIQAAVEELARRHVGYGVKAEHYGPVGEALIWTLQTGLGPAFTPDVRDAWVKTYGAITSVMLGATATAHA